MKPRGEGQTNDRTSGRQQRARRSRVFRRPNPRAAQKAFEECYPELPVDPALFRLVGVDPPLRLDTEKAAVRQALSDGFAAK
jgi:hypothetical protein